MPEESTLDPAATPVAEPGEPELGEAGRRALAIERDRAKTAERDVAKLKQQVEALKPFKQQAEEMRAAQESETERLQREAEDGRRLAAEGAAQLQQAHTITALAEAGLIGPIAQAAMRLVDGVTYDPTTHQPINLRERLDAAKALYGAQYFLGATPTPVPQNGATPPVPGFPAVHQGPRATPEPNEDEQFGTFMRTYFPQSVSPNGG
jgi:hypothetical protein